VAALAKLWKRIRYWCGLFVENSGNLRTIPDQRAGTDPQVGPDFERGGVTVIAADEALGIAWWNAMSERARLAALKAVEPEGRASPAERPIALEAWEPRNAAEPTALNGEVACG
jgi:hypothetical protein